LRAYGETLGLADPFEVKPGSRPLQSGRKHDAVAHREAIVAY
jgi:hypothetical protein